ncbi:MAG: cation:proton antiporter [Steroidobacteraceae bacterium]
MEAVEAVGPLAQVLILLTASVLVIALARRLGLPPTLGYLVVGMVLGPLAIGLYTANEASSELGELGVVFLLFTLGLEFSWPRMVAMRREVFGLGALQLLVVAGGFVLGLMALGVRGPVAAVLGGALTMSSTAIVVRQLTDQSEINRTHGRLSFAVLLFQDLAFVPLLALATALAGGGSSFTTSNVVRLVVEGLLALATVLAIGRWLLRPLLQWIAHSRLRELFTLAVLLVVLAAAWITQLVGLSMALGAFLAGMMLAESEYRHQVETVIRPFRELLLGLFFISVGTLLDLRLLYQRFFVVFALLFGMLIAKTLLTAVVTRAFVPNSFRALRTGVVLAGGGEFGVALLTILLQREGLVPAQWAQPLLVAVVVSMIASPLLIRYNKPITRMMLGEKGPPRPSAVQREEAAHIDVARREHVILCGFGRVGQNIARVLEAQGFEYLAVDLDPARIRLARQVGDPVVFGDSSDEELLEHVGLQHASAVIISFADPAVSVGIVRAIRHLRSDVPILVRTQDDAHLSELRDAGATEVVPETFEASLMLVSQTLMLLNVPAARVWHQIAEIRSGRYATLRGIFRHGDAPLPDETHAWREELRSVVLPPRAWAVGRTLEEIRQRGAEVAVTAIRRAGITGRDPAPDTELREGDVVVIYGTPAAMEHAEAVLLAG